MSPKDFVSKLCSKFVWYNILAMGVVLVMLLVGLIVGIGIYTHHGEIIDVPDVRRMSVSDADKILSGLGLIAVVSDTGYVKAYPPGTVLEMSPVSGTTVKNGREIYLTINALDTPTLTIPDVIDNSSYREAQAKLMSMGFKLGEPQYVTGEKDWVYGIKVRGRNVEAGDRVSVEDMLIIQVGSGQRDVNDSSLYIMDMDNDYPEEGDIDEFELVM